MKKSDSFYGMFYVDSLEDPLDPSDDPGDVCFVTGGDDIWVAERVDDGFALRNEPNRETIPLHALRRDLDVWIRDLLVWHAESLSHDPDRPLPSRTLSAMEAMKGTGRWVEGGGLIFLQRGCLYAGSLVVKRTAKGPRFGLFMDSSVEVFQTPDWFPEGKRVSRFERMGL